MLLALRNIKKVGSIVDQSKDLGDIRCVTYIYGRFYRFGVIDVPDEVKLSLYNPVKQQTVIANVVLKYTYI